MISGITHPYVVPDFTCLKIQASNNTTTHPQVSIEEIQAALNANTSSSIQNPAAAIARIGFSQIRSIGVLGDSVSAGLLVDNTNLQFWQKSKFAENRPSSWSNGIAENSFTLLNLMHQVSPVSIVGASTVSTKLMSALDNKESGLNMAVSRTKMVGIKAQADRYIAQISQSPVKDEWKMLNIMAGFNDMCDICTPNMESESGPAPYEAALRNVLETLRQSAIAGNSMVINLYGLFDITEIVKIENVPTMCTAMRSMADICPCLFGSSTDADHQSMKALLPQLNTILERVAREYQHNYLQQVSIRHGADPQKNAFIVLYQPMFTELDVNRLGLSIFTKTDCFHPNRKGQEAIAISVFQGLQISSIDAKKNILLQISQSPSDPSQDTGNSNEETAPVPQMAMAISLGFKAAPPSDTLKKSLLSPISALVNLFKRSQFTWICPDSESFIQ